MADYAHKWTDRQLIILERRIRKEYKKAAKELRKRMKEFFEDYGRRLANMQEALKAGTITAEQYKQWLHREAVLTQRYRAMIHECSEIALKANLNSSQHTATMLAGVYAENANYAAYTIEKAAGVNVSFALQDANTVVNLVERSPLLFATPKPDSAKVLAWMNKKLTSAVTQGILTGESIPKIAKRMERVYGADRAAAVRAARTAITGAENAGRLSSYEFAESIGIKLKKEWVATLDERTRDTHRELDGQRVDVDEDYVTYNGDRLRFPADPMAPAEEVYNCRCATVAIVEDLPSRDWRSDQMIGDLTYSEWKAGKRG